MNCLPLNYKKIVSDATLQYDGRLVFKTINKYTGDSQSFNDQPTKVYLKDRLIWTNHLGQLHREYNKPAVIYLNGDKAYYKNGYFQKRETQEDIE